MRWAFLSVFLLAAGWVSASPRVFAPVFLRPGSVNEVYVWDENPVGPFSVQVLREGADRPLVLVKGFIVDRPLSVLGADNRPLKWSAALVSPDVLCEPGPVRVKFFASDGTPLGEVSSEVRPRAFPIEDIALNREMSELRAKPNHRKEREAAEIWKIYQNFEPRFTWEGGRFLLPVSASVPTTAHFGDIRRYLYADGTSSEDYHRGIDFAVPVGTPVAAAAPGVVALTGSRMLTGISIVLEHAPGVYSVYFHLSRSLVKKGQTVAAGTLIGLSGATGLATGPHLHWEIRIDGVSVDPADLVVDGLLDTNIASAVISSVERPIH